MRVGEGKKIGGFQKMRFLLYFSPSPAFQTFPFKKKSNGAVEGRGKNTYQVRDVKEGGGKGTTITT